MSQAAGKFAPGGDTLGLHQLFPLRGEGFGHVVESGGKLADFVTALDVDVGVPAAGGNIASATGELFDGASDAPGDPPAQEQANEKSGKGHERSGLQNFAAQGDQFFARTAEQEHAE